MFSHHLRSSLLTPSTHGSRLRTFEEVFAVSALLNDAANETDLSDLFTAFP